MEDDELERIRARKYEAIMKSIVRRDAEGMASEPILVSDMSFDSTVNEYRFFPRLLGNLVWPLPDDGAHY